MISSTTVNPYADSIAAITTSLTSGKALVGHVSDSTTDFRQKALFEFANFLREPSFAKHAHKSGELASAFTAFLNSFPDTSLAQVQTFATALRTRSERRTMLMGIYLDGLAGLSATLNALREPTTAAASGITTGGAFSLTLPSIPAVAPSPVLSPVVRTAELPVASSTVTARETTGADEAASSSQAPLEVSTLINAEANGNNISVGVRVSYFANPIDPSSVFLCPEIYIQNTAPREPKHIMFLVDVSGSMAGLGIEAAKTVLHQTFDALADDDLISLTTFSTEIKPLLIAQPKSALAASFHARVEDLKTENATVLRDAILSVSTVPGLVSSQDASAADSSVAKTFTGHTTVVLVSDGADSGSKFTGTTAELFTAFNTAFSDAPPRFLPVGLGAGYDHEFIKQCSIFSNLGMVDARDQARMGEHIPHITASLAHGVHCTLGVGGEAMNLGVLNYNTANIESPISVPGAALAAGITLSIAGHAHHISAEEFVGLPIDQEKIGLYVQRQARLIYDNLSFVPEEKMVRLEALKSQYLPVMSEAGAETEAVISGYLAIIERKMLMVQIMEVATRSDRGGPMRVIRDDFAAQIDGLRTTFACRYPENANLLEDAKKQIAGGYSATASINRVPGSAFGVVDHKTANRYVNASSTDSRPSTYTLVQSSASSRPSVASVGSYVWVGAQHGAAPADTTLSHK